MRVSATPESMKLNGSPADESDERVRRVDDWDADVLRRLADEYGTPLYVTDLDRVRDNYRRIDAAFDDEEVMYAAKANTARAVLEALDEEDARIECAAGGEIQRAVEAGADAGEIQYTAVNPPDEDLDYAVGLWRDGASGMTFNVGAESTVERLAERGFDGRLCFRVNPGIGAGHHEKVATGAHPKFGVPYDRVPELVEHVRDEHEMEFVGLHAHMGSGMLDDDLGAHTEFVRRMSDLAEDCAPVEFVDIGGGFGVPYRDEEKPLDLSSLVEGIRGAFDADAELAVEPGRYVVGDAGILLMRVNTVKDTPETTVVGVDASMTTLVRPALYDAYHPIRNLSGGGETEPLTVGGPVCESTDVFCENRPMPRPERDDLLAVGVVGAYGYEMASQFHSQPRPADIGIQDGEVRPIRRRETVDDITEKESSF